MTVLQQIPGNIRLRCRKIEVQAIRFCIPVSRPTVFFSRKSFWSNVQAGIFACVRLEHMEDVKTNSLLGFDIPFNLHVRFFPMLQPGRFMCCKHIVKSALKSVIHAFHRLCQQVFNLIITIRDEGH